MAVSEARKKATAKYNAKAYDRIEIKVTKGRKEVIEAYAKSIGKSVNGFLNDLIDSKISK